MSTDAGDNRGKTAFVKEFLGTHRDAYHRTVSDAWTAAGNPGTISESLVGKVRREMGLTGRRERDGSTANDATASVSTGEAKASAKSQGAKRGPKSAGAPSSARQRAEDVAGERAATGRAKAAPESNARGLKSASASATGTTASSRPATGGTSAASQATAGTSWGGREGVLDRVEDGIDDLIVELKQLGGMDDALEALRKARRVVVRSLEG